MRRSRYIVRGRDWPISSYMFSPNLNFIVERDSDAARRPTESMSGRLSSSLPFGEAIRLGAFDTAHAAVQSVSTDGVVDWDQFDITPFGRWMPALATLDRVDTEDGEVDFIYRFVGESINTVAKRSLRGASLRQILNGPVMDWILQEYNTTLVDRAFRASTGTVTISDMTWMRYLRFLYPVKTGSGVNRILLFMLYDTAPTAG